MLPQRYYLSIADFSKARGADPELSYDGQSADTFAAALLAALRDPALFRVWRAKQPDPDAIEDSLGMLDPHAQVVARPARTGHGGDVEVVTLLPHALLSHRLRLIAGSNWTLRDVRAA